VGIELVQKLSKVAAAFAPFTNLNTATNKSKYVNLGRVTRGRREAAITRYQNCAEFFGKRDIDGS
jgi:hypothetical protein